MATYPLYKQTDGYNSPNDWLVSLAMDLAALCDTECGGEMTPMDAFWLVLVKM